MIKSFLPKGKIWMFALLLPISLVAIAWLPWFSGVKADYNTDVKPILNKKCMSCHGGVKRQGGFSLLTREDALQVNESGKVAIVPGHADQSEMIRRINLHDPEERMPYGKDALSTEEIGILAQWINDGAAWDRHWAYRAVENPSVPTAKRRFGGLLPAIQNDWVKNNIDWFIHEKLDQEKLAPSPRADAATLVQRVGLDLIGMPAPDSIANIFLSDSSDLGYEKMVDALLASPRFGERWASVWLDLARYADSKGYERDAGRNIWRYRDWLIRAFNDDMPYDRFLTEQLAGDLLPNPTDNQLIATAFHRNTMTNDEGGTDNEEYRTAAVVDRVNTTWEVLMGTTFACVQCHSHPYDPFKHEEYYQFLGFFNNSRDEDTYEEYPNLRHFSSADSLKLLALKGWVRQEASPEQAEAIAQFLKTLQPARYSIATDSFTNCALYDTKWLNMRHLSSCRMPNVALDGYSQLQMRFSAGSAGGVWTVHLDQRNGPILFSRKMESTDGKQKFIAIDFKPVTGKHDLWFEYRNPTLKKPDAAGISFNWFYFTQPFPGVEKPGYKSAKAEYVRLVEVETKGTPIMMDAPNDLQRETHVFERGNWLVKGDLVKSGVPNHLNPMPPNSPNNRLGMAQWLTDPKHPLTSRTMVNRVWEQLFGIGLVETLEDLGSQGATPTHPTLLDHLAWQWIHDQKWSVKQLLRYIVCSATYRQDARTNPSLQERDPYNRFYARGPRVRLSAEQLRDKTLAVAGVLSTKMYGPSVMPFQPEGIWETPWNGETWTLSKDDDRFRRAVYTFWKRSSPYPSMITFDGAGREVCTSRRIRTNTPLQALVTLNDSVYVEAAQCLARRIQQESPQPDINQQIEYAFQLAMYRKPDPAQLAALRNLYQKALSIYRAKPDEAAKLLGNNSKDQAETAALALVSSAILNLDEFLMKK